MRIALALILSVLVSQPSILAQSQLPRMTPTQAQAYKRQEEAYYANLNDLLSQFRKLPQGYIAEEIGREWEKPSLPYLEPDYRQAANWYQEAYALGSTGALFNITDLIAAHKLVYQDRAKVLTLMQWAAKEGSAPAKAYLAEQQSKPQATAHAYVPLEECEPPKQCVEHNQAAPAETNQTKTESQDSSDSAAKTVVGAAVVGGALYLLLKALSSSSLSSDSSSSSRGSSGQTYQAPQKSCTKAQRTWVQAGSSGHWQTDYYWAYGADCP